MIRKILIFCLAVSTVIGVQAQKKQKMETNQELNLDIPTHAEPVSVGAILLEGKKEGEKAIMIKTNIMEGYHIYAYVPKGEAYIKTELGIELPAGVELQGKWKKTSPASYPGKNGILIYKNEDSFKHIINVGKDVAKGTKIKCWLYYQCCDANICFPPKKKVFELILK